MRSPFVALFALLFVSLPSHAGVFDVSAQLQLSGPFGLTASASGSAAGVQSVGGGIAEVPGILISSTLPISPAVLGLGAVRIQGATLGPGTLNGTGGVLGVQGTAEILTAGTGLVFGNLPLTPLGSGGSSTGLLSGIFLVTLEGSSWQLGPVTATGSGTAMATGVDNRTIGGAGTVTFVSASTFAMAAAGLDIPSTSSLTLTYTLAAPEPALSLLTLAAFAALWGAIQRRS
ncbi:MAG: hypothetical protein QNK05_09455 [Myxococcota bacterium]|nr:hypothetical protein [Myxococcota bacterium]